MLTEICDEVRNYFCQDSDKHFGKFEISGGTIAPLDFLQDGQYFRIVGSVFNDGVHQWPCDDLADEAFDGAIWAMKVPDAFLSLVEEIKAFQASDAAKPTAYASESFGGYSYSRVTGPNGTPAGWQTIFSGRLNRWRRMRR